jgi:hypothetical protein
VRKRVSIPQYAPYRRSNSSGTRDVLGNCMKRGCEPETHRCGLMRSVLGRTCLTSNFLLLMKHQEIRRWASDIVSNDAVGTKWYAPTHR